MQGDGFRQNTTQAAQIDKPGHFPGVPKGARGDRDGISQSQPAELNVKANGWEIHDSWQIRVRRFIR
jgi:hypothetical protein